MYTTFVTARPKIVRGPSPVNVSVNANAVFKCLASDTNIIKWFANSTPIDNIPGLEDQQPKTEINATVDEFDLEMEIDFNLATKLNGSLMGCLGFHELPNVTSFVAVNNSAPARLLIQGDFIRTYMYRVHMYLYVCALTCVYYSMLCVIVFVLLNFT